MMARRVPVPGVPSTRCEPQKRRCPVSDIPHCCNVNNTTFSAVTIVPPKALTLVHVCSNWSTCQPESLHRPTLQRTVDKGVSTEELKKRTTISVKFCDGLVQANDQTKMLLLVAVLSYAVYGHNGICWFYGMASSIVDGNPGMVDTVS